MDLQKACDVLGITKENFTMRSVKKAYYQKALETIDEIKYLREKPNFFLKLASVLTKDNKYFMEDFLNQTSKWSIDFHELI